MGERATGMDGWQIRIALSDADSDIAYRILGSWKGSLWHRLPADMVQVDGRYPETAFPEIAFAWLRVMGDWQNLELEDSNFESTRCKSMKAREVPRSSSVVKSRDYGG